MKYRFGRLREEEKDLFDFEDGLQRSVSERIRLGFIPMKLPIVNDVPYRVFETMEEYRNWAAKALPIWLGYTLDER